MVKKLSDDHLTSIVVGITPQPSAKIYDMQSS